MPPDDPQQALQPGVSTGLEIRDIHLPDPISWWPPALGWWLLLLGLIAAICLLIWIWRRRLRKHASGKFLAQQELILLEQAYQTNKDHHQLMRDLSVLLRRTCVSIFPREECAGLTGDAWLEFLDSCSAQKGFMTVLGQQLIASTYAEKSDLDEMDEVIRLCKNWLEGLP